ncbi:MAG: hypothetical protein LBS72_04070 [Oscillospiraceae bacterium]|jgi:hypothetical protein|nr:hypothetical protein [Oscillospiraceae bacterium]
MPMNINAPRLAKVEYRRIAKGIPGITSGFFLVTPLDGAPTGAIRAGEMCLLLTSDGLYILRYVQITPGPGPIITQAPGFYNYNYNGSLVGFLALAQDDGSTIIYSQKRDGYYWRIQTLPVLINYVCMPDSTYNFIYLVKVNVGSSDIYRYDANAGRFEYYETTNIMFGGAGNKVGYEVTQVIHCLSKGTKDMLAEPTVAGLAVAAENQHTDPDNDMEWVSADVYDGLIDAL